MSIKILNGIDVDNGVLYTDTSNNRVGINTSSPQVPLEAKYTGTTDEILRIVGTASGKPQMTFYNDSTLHTKIVAAGNNDFSITNTHSTGDMFFAAGGLTRLHIEANGNVGIGTDSPSAKLHVGSTSTAATSNEEVRIQSATGGGFGGTATLNLVTGTYGTSGVYFGNNSTYTAQRAHVKWVDVSNMLEYNSDGIHVFKYSGSEIFRTSGTSIGMGVTGIPAAKLDIYNSSVALNVRSTQSVGIKVRGGANYNDIAQFSNSAGTVVAALDTAGQLGIGTNDPQAELHVQSPTNATPTIRLNHNSTYPAWMIEATQYNSASPPRGQLRWDANPGATGMQLVYWNSYTENALKLDGQNFKVINNGSERMRIDNTGDVGIGVTNPAEKLEVNGSVKATASTDAYKGYIKQNVISYAAEKQENANYYFTSYNTTATVTSAQAYNRIVAAYSGRVKKVYIRHGGGSTPTATAVNFKKNVNNITSVTVYSATVANTASANMTAYYEFADSDFTFNAGDLIGLLYQTTDAFGTASKTMGGVAVTITLEYNIT